METIVDFIAYVLVTGLLATAFMDLWAMTQTRLLGIPSLEYALVGRWLGHMPSGKFRHSPITAATPIGGERLIGWSAHYAIGVVFAGLFILLGPQGWIDTPTLGPALLFGAATVAAPYFILQPCMGAGIAARKTPKPNVAKLRSLVAHLSFGLGLYLAASLISRLTA